MGLGLGFLKGRDENLGGGGVKWGGGGEGGQRGLGRFVGMWSFREKGEREDLMFNRPGFISIGPGRGSDWEQTQQEARGGPA